jgi:hypothetical protein
MGNFNGGAELFFNDVETNVTKALGWKADELSLAQQSFISNIEHDSEAFKAHAEAIWKDKNSIPD